MNLAHKLQLVVLAVALVLLPGITSAKPAGPLVVGEICPLSGPAATLGIQMHRVTLMWAKELNAHGGIHGRKIKLISCDDGANPVKAARCTRDLIAKGIVALIMHSLTVSVHAAQPQVMANGPIMIVTSPNYVPPPNSYIFQPGPSDLQFTKATAAYLKASGVNTLAMVAATDASGEVSTRDAKKVMAAEHIHLKLARIDLRATDASNQLAAVAGKHIKIILSSYAGARAAIVVKSYHNLGLKQPLIVSAASLSNPFIHLIRHTLPRRLLGPSVRALVPSLVRDKGSRQRAFAFAKAYRAMYHQPIDFMNILAKLNVDTVTAMLEHVKNPADVNADKRYLESATIPSIQRIRFTKMRHHGLKDSDVIMVQLKNGGWIKAPPID